MENKQENNQEKIKNYFEHPGVAVEADDRFEHVMALALNPNSEYRDGVIRCITNREGDLSKKGYVDKSELYKVKGDSLESFQITDRLSIKNEEEIIEKYKERNYDFLGFEDPDIWIDEEKNIVHVYFTIAFKHKTNDRMIIGLGHAQGGDLDSLEMTEPVLIDKNGEKCAKELSIAPVNKKGSRYNLIESNDVINGVHYSTIKVAEAGDMGNSWKFGETVFHPYENNVFWAGEHASPGPLFSKSFIDVGENKLAGVMNGRSKSENVDKEIKYGMFSVGLFIYDYEKGKIDWVSPESFIQDSQATTITFASNFIETEEGAGVLYAHVDDSFVRAYSLKAEDLRQMLP
jgi:hypothetical protein